MKKYFHWTKKRKPYFEGWYLKHQNEGRTIAFIPAFHVSKTGEQSASLQVVTDEGAWYIPFAKKQMEIQQERFMVRLGENIFSEKGVHIHIRAKGLVMEGTIKYGPFHSILRDIMGPFRYVPLLECSHGIISMSHTLTGELVINGERIRLTGGSGYIETDWGSSFPGDYLWTQCNFGGCRKAGIMISAADIPLAGRTFKGCICCVHYQGQEYRMATYKGAVIKKYKKDEIWIQQGKMGIKAEKLGECAFGLKAPVEGDMTRTIYESPSCRVRYQFYLNGEKVFDMISSEASFEKSE